MARTIELRPGESLTLPDGTVIRALHEPVQLRSPDGDGAAEALERAAAILGSQNNLAQALMVSKGAVSQWKEEARRVPAEHCPAIERLTAGAARCEDLRPDMNWEFLRAVPPTNTTDGA